MQTHLTYLSVETLTVHNLLYGIFKNIAYTLQASTSITPVIVPTETHSNWKQFS